MKRIAILLIVLPLIAQSPPVFTQFTPASWGFAIGQSHCYAWNKLAPPWVTEIACYGPGLQQVQAQIAGQTMVGDFRSADGEFTWAFTPSISGNGQVSYQIAATPAGGMSLLQVGTF